MVSANFPVVADLPSLNSFQVYDNSGEPTLIARGGGGIVDVLDEEKYQSFLDKADE